MSKPTILVTNDDGIDSRLLHILVDVLKKDFDIVVAAPLSEKSWIGRAYSRYSEVQVTPREVKGCPGWAIDGTPSDCVNIALSHLLKEKPQAVLSGINLGYNTCLPIIFSSGTIAAALEGAFFGIPSMALSYQITSAEFETMHASHGEMTSDIETSLRFAAAHAGSFAKSIIGKPLDRPVVHNINYPRITTPETPLDQTILHKPHLGSFFEKKTDTSYAFRFPSERLKSDAPGTDYESIGKGNISYTALDFSMIGAQLVRLH